MNTTTNTRHIDSHGNPIAHGDRVMTEYGPGVIHSFWPDNTDRSQYDVVIKLDRGKINAWDYGKVYGFNPLRTQITLIPR
jgi:hypothetical protein